MSTEEIKEYIGTQLKALTSIASPTGGEIEPWMASFDGFVRLRKPWAQFVQSLSCVA